MIEKSAATIPVASGAEAFLEQVRALGIVRYLFANTGTDHGPIIEALAKTAKEDPNDIQPLVVPHELAAVSMAHGYYNEEPDDLPGALQRALKAVKEERRQALVNVICRSPLA